MGWPPPEFWLPARTHLRVHIQLKYVMLGGQHNFQVTQKKYLIILIIILFLISHYILDPLCKINSVETRRVTPFIIFIRREENL